MGILFVLILPLVIIVGLYIGAVFVDAFGWYRRSRGLKHLPHLPRKFLVGDIPFVSKFPDPRHAFRAIHSQLGDLFTVRLLWIEQVVLTHPEDVKKVMMIRSEPKPLSYQRAAERFGHGLPFINGDLWKRHRKLLQKGFTPSQLRSFIPRFQHHASQLVARLQKLPSGSKVDISDLFTAVTLDIIGSAGLRLDLGAIAGKQTDVGRCIHRLLISDQLGPLLLLPLGGLIHSLILRKYHKPLDAILNEAFQRGMQDLPEPGAPPRDLLDILMAARDGLTKREIMDELFIFFLAGHETTALTLTYCIHLLTANPEWQQKVIDEVDAVTGGEEPSFEHLSQLTTLTMVLKETLRLFPPTSQLGRELSQDTELSGKMVPKGSQLLINMDIIHKRPEFWPNPEKFDPLRFTPENSVGRHEMAFMPFTNGPRICIGQHFFWQEAKIVLANLFQRFRFDPDPRADLRTTTKTGTTKFVRNFKAFVHAR